MSNLKQLRGQVRQTVKELLSEVMTTELFAALEKRLFDHINSRMDKLDKRQQDIASYFVRQSVQNLKAQPVKKESNE